MKKLLKWGFFAFLGLIVLGVIASIAGGGEEAPTTAENPAQEEKKDEQSQEKQDSNKNEVTMEEYKKIKEGMSYDEVVEVVGFEGKEMSSASAGKHEAKVYQWVNPDGISNMTVTFSNDKVMSKAQAGLE